MNVGSVARPHASAMRLAPPWPSAAHLRAAAAGALDLVLPPRALDDDRRPASVQSPGLTTQAWSRITFIEAPFCVAAAGAFRVRDRGRGRGRALRPLPGAPPSLRRGARRLRL